MLHFSIIDPFNLRDFIKTVVDFVRQNDDFSTQTTIQTTLDFLKIVLSGIEEKTGKKSKPVTDIQKVLSGNIAPDKLDYIFAYNDQLYRNCKLIADEVEKLPQYRTFLSDLVSGASLKFFLEEEIEKLSATLNASSANLTQDLIFQFIEHGLRNLNRIPAQLAQSLYSEAQTYDYNQPLRFSLLKAAADCGSKEAALEYGNYANRLRNRALSAEEIEEAFSYTLMAIPMDAALWNLAFLLEDDCLSKKQIELLEAAVKIEGKIIGLSDNQREELQYVECTLPDPKRKSVELAYKINFYLSCKGFSKAFNSLAKYLCSNSFGFQLLPNDRFENKDQLIEHYYRKAIAGGNILAYHNMGSKIKKKYPKQGTEEFLFAEDLLQTSVSMGMDTSYEALGLLYLDAGKSEEAQVYLEHALNHGGHKGLILYKLGIINPRLEEKVKFFLKAIQEGYPQAAIDYALCEHNLFLLDNKTLHIRSAISILQQYSLSIANSDAQALKDIQNELEDILKRTEIAK